MCAIGRLVKPTAIEKDELLLVRILCMLVFAEDQRNNPAKPHQVAFRWRNASLAMYLSLLRSCLN